MSARRKRCGSWTSWTVGQVGQAHILNSNYYNLLIINHSNILEEKTRGCPTCPTCPTVQLSNFSDQIAEDDSVNIFGLMPIEVKPFSQG